MQHTFMYGTSSQQLELYTAKTPPRFSKVPSVLASADAERAQRGDPGLVARAGPLSVGVV